MLRLITKNTDVSIDTNNDINVVIQDLIFSDYVGLDLVTTGSNPHIDKIIRINIGNKVNQYIIDMNHFNINELKNVLTKNTLLMNKAKTQIQFLYKYGIYPKSVYDIDLVEQVVNKAGYFPESPEPTRNTLNGFIDKTFDYFKIIDILSAVIEERELERSVSIENTYLKALAYIEYCGIGFNVGAWRNKLYADKLEIKMIEGELLRMISNSNINKYIEAQMDLFDNKKKACLVDWGNPNKAKSFLKDIKRNYSDKYEAFKEKVIELEELYKESRSWGENIPEYVSKGSGRIHGRFKQISRTGRVVPISRDEVWKDRYMNLTSIPNNIKTRSRFLPNPNNILISGDYEEQEFIIFANQSKSRTLMRFYKNNRDIHSYIAKHIFSELKDLSIEEIAKDYKDKRSLAKKIIYAYIYGGDVMDIKHIARLEPEEARRCKSVLDRLLKDCQPFIRGCIKNALKAGYVRPNNVTMKRLVIPCHDDYVKAADQINEKFWENYKAVKIGSPELFKSHYLPIAKEYFTQKSKASRAAVSYKTQGTAADVMKTATILLFDYIVKSGYQDKVLISNTVFDELLIECPKDMSCQMKKILDSCMIKAGKIYCKNIDLKADIKVLDYWYR